MARGRLRAVACRRRETARDWIRGIRPGRDEGQRRRGANDDRGIRTNLVSHGTDRGLVDRLCHRRVFPRGQRCRQSAGNFN